jgi:uncharacterized membrane protein
MPVLDLPFIATQAVPSLLASDFFHPPMDGVNVVQLLLRWLHFLAGIIWIGHLYFFNLVNVNLMKVLDGPTKGKVIPQLMPRALWWFRWGALITVLVGLMYYAMYMLPPNYRNAKAAYEQIAMGPMSAGSTNRGPMNVWVTLLVWLLILVVTFAIEMAIMKKVNDGRVLGVIIGVLVSIASIVIIWWLNYCFTITVGGQASSEVANNTISIGIGGGLGVIMLFNVWGIIWPNQKRIISWTGDNAESGTAVPAESAKLARVAFLASRTNTWLSVPMLLLMAISSHHAWFGR